MGWFRRNEHDEEQLSAYLDGELEARHAEKVERHLATCDACAALLEELRETRTLLSALPMQALPRSFVLGAEYAREPVREAARPPKRFNFALAPAVALSVFVALLVVDVADFGSTASDESTSALTAEMARQATEGDAVAPGATGAFGAASSAQNADSSAESPNVASGKAGDDGTQPATAPVAPEGGAGAAVPDASPPPAAMSAAADALPTASPSDAAVAMSAPAHDEGTPENLAFDAPEADGDGLSTLRILEIVAAAAFLASGFYVFVWPRLSRGGS